MYAIMRLYTRADELVHTYSGEHQAGWLRIIQAISVMLRRWGPSSPRYVYNTVPTYPPRPTGAAGFRRYVTAGRVYMRPTPAIPSMYARERERELGNSCTRAYGKFYRVIRGYAEIHGSERLFKARIHENRRVRIILKSVSREIL